MADNTVKVKIEGDATGAVAAANSVKNAITGLSSHAAGAVGGFASLAAGATKELAKIGVTAGTVAATVTSALAFKGLKANAQFEDYNVQFATLIKNSKDFAATYPNLTSEQDKFAKATELAGDKMKDLAKFGAETPFELPQVVEAQKILMGFGLASQDTAKRFGKSSDDILRIAGDVASGTGASFQEIALDMGKFSSGATGEAIARFQELGIVTRRELEDMGLKFTKSGELIVNSQEDMDKATTVVFNAMQKKFGGLMDAQSKTFNGILSNIKDNIGLWMREVSKPIFEPLKNGLNDVYNFMSSDAGKKAMEKLQGYVQEGVDKIAEYFNIGRDAIITFRAALNGDWANAEGINPFVAKIGEFGLLLRDTVIPAVQGFIDKVAPIASTLFGIYQALSPLQTVFEVIKGFFTGGIDGAIQAFKDRVSGAVDVFQEWGPKVLGFLGQLGQQLLGWIGEQIPGIVSQLQQWGQAFLDWIGPQIPPLLERLGQLASQFFSWIGQQIPLIVEQLARWGKEFVDWLLQALPGMMDGLGKLGGQLLAWIGEQAPKILDQLLKWASSFLDWITQDVLPKLLPELEKIGHNIVQFILDKGPEIAGKILEWSAKFWQWVQQDAIPKLLDALGQLAMSTMRFIGEIPQQIGQKMLEWANAFLKWVGEVVTKLPGELGKIIVAIFKWISDGVGMLLSKAGEIGKAIIDGIVNGIMGGLGKIKDAVTKAIGDPIGFAKDLLGIHSPSTVFAEMGEMMMQGLALGIDKNKVDAIEAVSKVATDLANIISKGGEAFKALEGYSAINNTVMNQFFSDVHNAMIVFTNVASTFQSDGLKSAGEFADAASKMTSLVGSGVNGLMELSKYSAISNDQMNQFFLDLTNTMIVFGERAKNFDDKGLQASGLFADAAGKVVGIIGNAVQGFTALADFKGVPPAAIQALVDGISYTVELATVAAGKMETDMMVQVGVFGEAVGKLFNGFKAAIDTFAGLEKFKATPSNVIRAFISELEFTVSLASDLAAKADKDMIAETGKFSEAVGKIFNGLKSAMDLFKSLETFKGYPADAVKKLMDGIKAAIGAMAETNKQVDTFLVQATHFADTIAEAVGKINAGLGDLKGLEGISVSANVTVGSGGGAAKALGGLTSGLTLWGEAGPEAANVPGRGLMLANSPTLSNFPPGTRVYSAGETKQLTTNMGGVTIQIYTQPGQDAHAIAQEVKRILDDQSGIAALSTRLRN